MCSRCKHFFAVVRQNQDCFHICRNLTFINQLIFFIPPPAYNFTKRWLIRRFRVLQCRIKLRAYHDLLFLHLNTADASKQPATYCTSISQIDSVDKNPVFKWYSFSTTSRFNSALPCFPDMPTSVSSGAGKGPGVISYTFFYVIGHTITNMAALTINPLITNDPKQRPTISVWPTALNYLVSMNMTNRKILQVFLQKRKLLKLKIW